MKVLDSATAPTLQQAQQARAQGYRAWLGYLPPSPGWTSAEWPLAGFDAVRQAGLKTGGIKFGPDGAGAVQQCHERGLEVCFVDIEPNDPGHYAPGVAATLRQAGITDGIYGNLYTVEPMPATVHWYYKWTYDGRPMAGGQEIYGLVVAGVKTDVSTFDPAVFGGSDMGGAFKPGTHELHWCEVAADRSITHYWQDLSSGDPLHQESLGGEAVGEPWLAWSDDGQLAAVTVLGLAGEVYRAVYPSVAGPVFGGFGVVAGATGIVPPGSAGPPGPQGPPGPPGTTPASGKITDGTVTFG